MRDCKHLFGWGVLVFHLCFSGCSTSEVPSQDKKNEELTNTLHSQYLTTGKQITQAAQLKIETKLSEAVSTIGFAKSLHYCKTNATVLTNEFGVSHNVSLKRVSDRPRRPSNNASTLETQLIAKYRTQLSAGLPLEPVVLNVEQKLTYYSPIVTQPFCLNCHGTPMTINSDVSNRLTSLYPEDKAINYESNEIRGLWRVVFESTSTTPELAPTKLHP